MFGQDRRVIDEATHETIRARIGSKRPGGRPAKKSEKELEDLRLADEERQAAFRKEQRERFERNEERARRDREERARQESEKPEDLISVKKASGWYGRVSPLQKFVFWAVLFANFTLFIADKEDQRDLVWIFALILSLIGWHLYRSSKGNGEPLSDPSKIVIGLTIVVIFLIANANPDNTLPALLIINLPLMWARWFDNSSYGERFRRWKLKRENETSEAWELGMGRDEYLDHLDEVERLKVARLEERVAELEEALRAKEDED